jgi:hypothetical protein
VCQAKNTDYAHSEDAWGNLGLVEALYPPGEGAFHLSKEMGVVVRLADKLQRVAGATYKPLQVKDETVFDTCDDGIVYFGILKAMFAERLAQRAAPEGPALRRLVRQKTDVAPPGRPLRIYVTAPYTGDGSPEDKYRNTCIAKEAARALALKGHYPHCPHAATAFLDGNKGLDYEYFMRMDLYYIQTMMDAVLRLPGDSPGAEREVKLAKAMGLPVYTSVDEVPDIVEPKETADESETSTAPPPAGSRPIVRKASDLFPPVRHVVTHREDDRRPAAVGVDDP